MRLIVISFYSGVIFVLHSDKEYQLLLSSYSGMAFVLQSNQETTFAYPLTQAWPSSCGQTKKQLLLILLLRPGLRLAVKPRNNFCLSSYSGIAFVLRSGKAVLCLSSYSGIAFVLRSGKAVLCLSSLMPLQLFTQANHFTNNG